jgi:putative transposase
MARPPRIEIPGGWYYVLSRSSERRLIFTRDGAYEQFLSLVAMLPERFGIRVHGYALLPDRYHLQLETPRANLSKAVQWLNVGYSVWVNRRSNRAGPLFRGRFKAIIHDPKQAALTINRYIHLSTARSRGTEIAESKRAGNREPVSDPIKALNEYPWSSYGAYTGVGSKAAWLTSDQILTRLGEQSEAKLKRLYRRQIEDAATEGNWEDGWLDDVKSSIVYGDPAFVTKIRKLLVVDPEKRVGLRRPSKEPLSWKAVCRAIAKVWGEPWERLAASAGNRPRDAALYLSRRFGERSLRELGELVGGLEYPAVGMAITRFEERMQREEALRSKLNEVKALLKLDSPQTL